ncbi:hypothetical protein [Phytohabitans flavus]|nr:hypothetical protein [Phytohabitans flavus]
MSALLFVAALGVVAVVPGTPEPTGDLVHRVTVDGHAMSVLVAPERPGWNLVLLSGAGAAAGTRRDHMSPANSRPGAEGAWALVKLPEGSSRLWVRQDGHTAMLTVDTGREPAAVDLRGPDGPECASAVLGAHLAGTATPAACPADQLSPVDGAALRATVGFVAARKDRAITLVTDASPRSAAAAEVVRAAAAREGVTVLPEGAPAKGPAVVVAGWEAAAAALDGVLTGGARAEATYLAPWLFSPPLLAVPAGQLVAAPFAPDGERARHYLGSLGAALPGAAPTGAGFAAWLGTGHEAGAESTRLYAPVSLNPRLLGGMAHHDHGGASGAHWLAGGRLTAVSGPLAARAG